MAMSASLSVEDRSVLARSTETEPDAAHGMDQWIGLVPIDLAADTPHIHVNDVGRGIEMQIPDVLQQHGPGDHMVLIAHQVLQQLEFPRLQGDFPAGAIDSPRHQVELEI